METKYFSSAGCGLPQIRNLNLNFLNKSPFIRNILDLVFKCFLHLGSAKYLKKPEQNLKD